MVVQLQRLMADRLFVSLPRFMQNFWPNLPQQVSLNKTLKCLWTQVGIIKIRLVKYLTEVFDFHLSYRSRGSWLQHHIQRCPHRWQRSHLCQKHSPSRGCHPWWSIKSWGPAAGGGAALFNFLLQFSQCVIWVCVLFQRLILLADMYIFQSVFNCTKHLLKWFKYILFLWRVHLWVAEEKWLDGTIFQLDFYYNDRTAS